MGTPSRELGSPLDAAGLAELRELMHGSADDMRDLFFVFMQEAASSLNDLRAAASERDAARLARTAHSLKGSSGNVAALRLAHLCGDLENLAQRGELETAGAAVDLVEAELELVRAQLAAQFRLA